MDASASPTVVPTSPSSGRASVRTRVSVATHASEHHVAKEAQAESSSSSYESAEDDEELGQPSDTLLQSCPIPQATPAQHRSAWKGRSQTVTVSLSELHRLPHQRGAWKTKRRTRSRSRRKFSSRATSHGGGTSHLHRRHLHREARPAGTARTADCHRQQAAHLTQQLY